MKVLVAHNFYISREPSGENSAVRRDVDLLRRHGHDVVEFTRSSDDITPGALLAVNFGVRARRPRKDLARVLDAGWVPDVVHVHNLFPLLTTSVLDEAVTRGIPTVQTIHNYRRTCAAGTHYRNERFCEECTSAVLPWPAVAHGCYRGSRLQSIPVAVNQVIDRRLWAQLDAHVVLTRFVADRMIALGADPASVVVRPTSTSDPGTPDEPGRTVLFIGRLSPEKGIRLLLDAWIRTAAARDVVLEVIGNGPDAEHVAGRAAASGGSIVYHGERPADFVSERIRACALVAVPSLWYEGLPTVVAEAFAHGRPVLACDTPNARSFIADGGWLCAPTVDGLGSALDARLANRHELLRAAADAREHYLRHMTPSTSYARLLAAYEAARIRRIGRPTGNHNPRHSAGAR
ncbi:glycosyltransferase family 4 protein [Pseudonocardia sp. RS010]|uniref:glycosyltransferase family 4 protein n=1 Tax=Pseudonocardia sp. RS010 TaxID=3385979 RepID=UPI00399F8207